MDIGIGAMGTLLPKLAKLVTDEYKLQKGVKREIEELNKELEGMIEALRAVAEVPPDQLDKQTRIWAGDVRELSYDIEDKVDAFMLSGKQEHEHTKLFSLDLYKKIKTKHKMHYVIKDIMDQVKNVAERRDRCKIDNIAERNIAARPAIVVYDPRIESMQKKADELVGIGGPKSELTKQLLEQDCSSSSRQQPNIISIFGFGGLGKTTLANSLYQDLKLKFNCHIFVSVSLNPDIKKIFKNILLQLDEKNYSHLDEGWEVNQLIDKIKEFLKDKRCLCVIDDLWQESAWDVIKLAFQDGDPGSRIIITTRYKNVAEHVRGGMYELKPLSDDDSLELVSMRIFDRKDGCPPNLAEVIGKTLKKCGGVPLAIITIASLLATKPTVEWEEVNKSINSGLENTLDVDKMRKILSLSYNDLPFHLKTCLLSLSKYPEDHMIRKDVLVCSWIAEGFIKQEREGPGGQSLQEIAESYFHDLINRSLIQPVQTHDDSEQDGQVHCCQVHDMVLELINKLSAEEGFVTVLLSEDGQQASTLTSAIQKRKIRRLSLNNNSIKIESYVSKASRDQLSKIRSLDVFGWVKSIPRLSSFHVLRVLQVDDCSRLDSNCLNDLGKLRLLRFLRLHGLGIDWLPESIGELESLETLDIRRGARKPMVLPVSLAKLGKLVQLLGYRVKLPDGLTTLENMTSLRELRGIEATMHAVNEICKLKELMVLELRMVDHSNEGDELIVKCLQSFPSLQVFTLWAPPLSHHFLPVDLMARLPYSLRAFTTGGFFSHTAFPYWTKSQLSYLTILHLTLCTTVRVLPHHLEQLAELPSLRFLKLEALHQRERLNSAYGFLCLTHLELVVGYTFFLNFHQGAMPKLQKLHLEIECLKTNTFNCGLDNLPSLRHVVICSRDQYFRRSMDTTRKAISNHPNHPSLVFAKV